jgi:hypothetical protein
VTPSTKQSPANQDDDEATVVLYLSTLQCPHCEFRWRVCVAADGPVPSDRLIVVRCPNDNSAHRVPLSVLQTTTEPPPRVEPGTLDDPDGPSVPVRFAPAVSVPGGGIGPLVAWVYVFVGAAVVSDWLLFR